MIYEWDGDYNIFWNSYTIRTPQNELQRPLERDSLLTINQIKPKKEDIPGIEQLQLFK